LNQYWFAFSDTLYNKAAPVTNAQGLSSAWGFGQDTSDWTGEFSLSSDLGWAELNALLNKGDAKTHPYAGYAELGTGLGTKLKPKDLTGLTGIGFQILAGGSDPDNPVFDKAKLLGVSFKVAKASVGDSVTYAANIPFGAINANVTGDFVDICVDLAQLKQPAWYSAKVGNVAFKPNDLVQMSWALKIQKDADATAKLSQVDVKSVKLYGSDKFVGVKGAANRSAKALSATYGKSLVVSFSVPGSKAELEVVRLDGSKVASFATAASVTNLALPVSLKNGTYMVVVRGEGARQVVSLSVVR